MYDILEEIYKEKCVLERKLAKVQTENFWIDEAIKQGLCSDYDMYEISAELEKYGPVIKVRGYKMKRLYDGSHYKDFCGIAEYTQYNKSWDINNFNDK